MVSARYPGFGVLVSDVLADRDVRLLAFLLDLGLAGLTITPVVLAYAVTHPADVSNSVVVAASHWIAGVGLIGLMVGQGWLLTVRGQTLGKRALGIRVERDDGSRADFGRVVLRRYVVPAILGIACGLFASVDALLLLARDRRTLHDRMAGTRVVRVDRSAP